MADRQSPQTTSNNGDSQRTGTKKIDSWFSRRGYAAAFGRYEGLAPAEEPYNEVLVGRESQRARLLTLLFNTGPKGAYLVTGHRGSGKTTFVDYCLKEYQRSAYERYLRSNVGRAYLWDRLGLIAVAALILLIAVLVHQGLAYLLELHHADVLVWPLILGLGLLAIYPLVSALERFNLVSERCTGIYRYHVQNYSNLRFIRSVRALMPNSGAKTAPRLAISFLVWIKRSSARLFFGNAKPNVRPLLFLLSAITFAAFCFPAAEPKAAVAQLALLSAWVYFAANLLSFWKISTWRGTMLNAVAVIAGYFFFYGLSHFRFPEDHRVAGTWMVATSLLASGMLIVAFQQWVIPRKYQVADKTRLKQTRRAVESSAGWFFGIGALVVALTVLCLYVSAPATLWIAALAAPVALLAILPLFDIYMSTKLAHEETEDDEIFRLATGAGQRRLAPLSVLLIKGWVFVILALQLAFPAAGYLWQYFDSAQLEEKNTLQAVVRIVRDVVPKGVEGSLIRSIRSEKPDPPPWSCQAATHVPRAAILAVPWSADGPWCPESSSQTPLIIDETPGLNLFDSWMEIFYWLAGMIVILLFLAFLEYEWIVRAFRTERTDPGSREVSMNSRARPQSRFNKLSRTFHQQAATQTFFWQVTQAWIPVITVPVNLGFDTLDHRRVVEAMLAGLRDKYQSLFGWKSSFTLVVRMLGLILLLGFTMRISSQWFHLDEEYRHALDQGRFCWDYVPTSMPVTRNLAPVSTEAPPAATRLACHVGGETLVQLLEFRIVGRSPERRIRTEIIDTGYPVLEFTFPELTKRGGMTLKVYHLLIFFFLWTTSSWYLRRRPLLPYGQILKSINELLDSLSSRLREEVRVHESAIPQIVGLLTGGGKVRHREADPFDPRTVELAALGVLRQIQTPALRLPFVTTHRVNLPIPEVIFKFDELDKLGLGVIPQRESTGHEISNIHRPKQDTTDAKADVETQERQRAQALQQLFSELKNVVNSGAARFIFVGGRNLHDEWLADQTARRPLLTNIFDAELYLPSLMIDGWPWARGDSLWTGVKRYMLTQKRRAEGLNERFLQLRYRPWLTPWVEERQDLSFAHPDSLELATGSSRTPPKGILELEIRYCDEPLPVSPPKWTERFQQDFLHFLTYRSLGNVKRLRTLLEGFIEPASSVIPTGTAIFDCQHVLRFQDVDRFRIQLIADIYRHIAAAFDPRLIYRDEKIVIGVFYLADFLLKFHRRAFTWNSLQKVDELTHIHRAPELPKAVSELVLDWTEVFLHPIRNGMYDYRFNSEFARELEYLSRRSEEELAAFNFTLDESQALKAVYRSRIQAASEPHCFEFVAALAELHEFDEEYDVARYHYARAIHLLDTLFHSQSASEGSVPSLYRVLSNDQEGRRMARLRLAWGVSRLRLKLQIGLSFEKSQDLEQAQAYYRNARSFAAVLVEALLSTQFTEFDNFIPYLMPYPNADNPDEGQPDYVSTLKHLNILFEPAFAEAWTSEKVVGGVDTSLRLLERRLWELRWTLPFVREEFLKDKPESGHPNFALIMAEQHNKAGDLFFYKGKRLSTLPDADERQGYLRRALYHYAVSLHEVRFFNLGRANSLRSYHEPRSAGDQDSSSTSRLSWSDFVFRTSAGSLADLAATLWSQLSWSGLGEALCNCGDQPSSKLTKILASQYDAARKAYKDVLAWLESSESPASVGWGQHCRGLFPSSNLLPLATPLGSIDDWFGLRSEDLKESKEMRKDAVQPLLQELPTGNGAPELLANCILFSLASGRLLEQGGYFEDAAKSHLRVLETISHNLWWFAILRRLHGFSEIGEPPADHSAASRESQRERVKAWREKFGAAVEGAVNPLCLVELVTIATISLEQADRLFRQRRVHIRPAESDERGKLRLIGRVVPVDTLTLTTSLALALLSLLSSSAEDDAGQAGPSGVVRDLLVRLSETIFSWTGPSLPKAPTREAEFVEWQSWFRETLRAGLEEFSYPVINRLNGLKILVDDALLGLLDSSEPAAELGKTERQEELRRAARHIEELVQLEDLYESPLHFSPLHSGLSLALFYFLIQKPASNWRSIALELEESGELRRTEPEFFGRLAWERLWTSQEMVSMGRSYYNSISDQYYLYDDFNDRRIHYNHAVQMVATELSSLTTACLEWWLSEPEP